MQSKYMDATAPNFEDISTNAALTDSESTLKLFSETVWGPTPLPDTTLWQLNQTAYSMVGNRLSSAYKIIQVGPDLNDSSPLDSAGQ
jgi:hypothetical protein